MLARHVLEIHKTKETDKMGRDLINQELNADNIDEAKFSGDVDPIDTLQRIASAWLALRRDWLPIQVKCRCGSNEACEICEIDYLLCEAFTLQSHY